MCPLRIPLPSATWIQPQGVGTEAPQLKSGSTARESGRAGVGSAKPGQGRNSRAASGHGSGELCLGKGAGPL